MKKPEKKKITIEMAEEMGLIPKVNHYRKMGIETREVDENTYRRRFKERNDMMGADKNDRILSPIERDKHYNQAWDEMDAWHKEVMERVSDVDKLTHFLKHEWKELECIDECYMERLATAISNWVKEVE